MFRIKTFDMGRFSAKILKKLPKIVIAGQIDKKVYSVFIIAINRTYLFWIDRVIFSPLGYALILPP